jgi:U4/U6 small nuclear ribonucleoprotein PRP4
MAAQTQHVAEDKMKDVFYTEGAEELKAARIWIANFSLPRTGARLAASKRKQVALAAYVEKKQAKMRTASEAAQPKAGSDDDDTAMQAEEMVVEGEDEVDEEHTVFMDKAGRYRAMELGSSQIGDVRPISGANFSPDGQCLATCSWSGIAKVWTVPDCIEKFQLLGHSERLTDVKFSPGFKTGMLGQTNDGKTVGVATASADMRVKLWSANDMSDLHTLEGHTARLARIDFHPSGRFLGTASFDRTWRLWDLETQKALLVQEGHARAVYNIRFQRDGALAASTGLDAVCRVWDLRTGRSVITLQGHVKQVLGMDFCPSGVRLATGSDDNTVRVWDLRRRKALTVLPAHPSLVSSVKYSSCGDFLFTASYDRTVKVWNMLNNTCITTLAGHDEKVMCVDVSPEDTTVITTSYDRTFKLWTPGSY